MAGAHFRQLLQNRRKLFLGPAVLGLDLEIRIGIHIPPLRSPHDKEIRKLDLSGDDGSRGTLRAWRNVSLPSNLAQTVDGRGLPDDLCDENQIAQAGLFLESFLILS